MVSPITAHDDKSRAGRGGAAPLGLGLTGTSLVMASLLIVVLVFQFRARRYVSWIHWLAVVLISVVGTLITDNLTDNFGVSLETTTIAFSVALAATFATWYGREKTYWISALLFVALIAIAAIAHFGFKVNAVLAFWIAYILTRPLGASLGDYLSQPSDNGGLGLGTVGTSAQQSPHDVDPALGPFAAG
ncbi:MAG TPA: hypothetical protein VGP04_09205 [Pseudonocardiaceae bacterium]|nr:hypothetical protein [Pseudonocardiaceae bacterium]